MKLKSLFLFPANFLKVFVKLSKTKHPLYAFNYLVHENYYSFKYRLFTPYLFENQESTNSLSFEKDVIENVPGNYYMFHTALAKVGLSPKDISFLDIGCGTGRFVSVGIQLGFKFNRGIDLDKAGLEIAGQNARISCEKTGRSDNYEISYNDASFYAVPEDVNVIYLYNPFGEKTMRHVVENIVKSFLLKQRVIYIMYVLPTFESVFLNSGFECIYSFADKTRKTLSVLELTSKGSTSK